MILDDIVARKHCEIAERKARRPQHVLEQALKDAPALRGFAAGLMAVGRERPAVIAEVKRGSPSLGCIRPDLIASDQAAAYQQGGAAALSILTDEHFFFGNDADFEAARERSSLPMLRKEFIIDTYQVYESRVLGADCILLIMSILSDDQAAILAQAAHQLGMDVLAETHCGEEIARVLASVEFDLIGVNNRNLKTFSTSTQTTMEFAERVPDRTKLVAESGLHTPEVIRTYWDAGISKFLVGEAFVRSADPQATVYRFTCLPSIGK